MIGHLRVRFKEKNTIWLYEQSSIPDLQPCPGCGEKHPVIMECRGTRITRIFMFCDKSIARIYHVYRDSDDRASYINQEWSGKENLLSPSEIDGWLREIMK